MSKFPKFKFKTKELEKYRGVLKASVKTFAQERPYDYQLFQKHTDTIVITTPPQIDSPDKEVMAWHKDEAPNTIFLSEKQFQGPPEEVDKEAVIGSLAHETIHDMMREIPDTPEEEKMAEEFEKAA